MTALRPTTTTVELGSSRVALSSHSGHPHVWCHACGRATPHAVVLRTSSWRSEDVTVISGADEVVLHCTRCPEVVAMRCHP